MGKRAHTYSTLISLGTWKTQGSHLHYASWGVGEQLEERVNQV